MVTCVVLVLLLLGLTAPRGSWRMAARAASYPFAPINGPYGGCISSVAISPSYANDGTVVVGTSNGLFLSSDRAATFTVVRNGLENYSQSITGIALAPDYARSRLMLVSTEDGLYRSMDGGGKFSYSNRSLGGDSYVNAVGVSPTMKDDGIAFAAPGLGGLWRSSDTGRSWVPGAAGLTSQNVVAIAASPSFSADHTMLVGIESSSEAASAWLSLDAGVTAAPLPLPTEMSVSAVGFSPAFGSDRTFAVGAGVDGVFVTNDGGRTFRSVYAGTVTAILFSPSFPTTHELFIGTAGQGIVVLDTLAGTSRAALLPGELNRCTITSLAASPAFGADGTLFAGTGRQGLLVSRDGGKAFADSSVGILGARVNSVAVSPTFATDRTVFFGTAYQGVARTSDGGRTVAYCNSGLGSLNVLQTVVAPSYGADGTVFAGTDGGGLYVSRNRGDSWQVVNGTGGSTVPWIAVAPDYATSATGFVSIEGQGLWKTTDGFATMKRCPDLVAAPDLGDAIVDCIAVSPTYSTDRTVYADTHSGRLYVSSDGGATFSYLARTGLPMYAVKDLRISPAFAVDRTLYMCTDYRGKMGGIWKSVDRGVTWQLQQGDSYLDAIRISDAYATDGTVLIVSWDAGLAVSTNRGFVFASAGSGIPLVSFKYWANALDISPSFSTDKVVYVGLTNGGVYTTYRFDEAPIGPRAPVLQAPSDGSTTGTLSPALSWSAVSDATGYSITVASNASFTAIDLSIDAGARTSFIPGEGVLEKGKTYFWRANARNAQGVGAWSQTFSFRTAGGQPSQTVITMVIGSTVLTVNGSPRNLDAAPMIKEGRTLVPIRAIVEAVGGTIAYDGKDGKGRVDIRLGGAQLSLWIGRSTATLNGSSRPIDPANGKVVPIIQGGRTYLPVRFVGESLGFIVGWDATTRTVTLTLGS